MSSQISMAMTAHSWLRGTVIDASPGRGGTVAAVGTSPAHRRKTAPILNEVTSMRKMKGSWKSADRKTGLVGRKLRSVSKSCWWHSSQATVLGPRFLFVSRLCTATKGIFWSSAASIRTVTAAGYRTSVMDFLCLYFFRRFIKICSHEP